MSHYLIIGLLVFVQEGETALLLASLKGHVEVVAILLKARVMVNIPDKVKCQVVFCNNLCVLTLYTLCGTCACITTIYKRRMYIVPVTESL